MMELAQIADAVNGQLLGANVMLAGVTTDSRVDCSDRLFIALRGENHDAHDFIGQAQLRGAAAVLIEQEINEQLPAVLVADTHKALMELAGWWRSQFVLPLVGITGSVGKTSVKEMLGRIFAGIGNGVVTHGNLNNEIGMPLTLLRLRETDQYAIIEMGMNAAGEIERLSKVARPTIALINNAAAAHLEGLGSVAAVAAAKGEIFQGLSADGIAVVNLDDDYADFWLQLAEPHPVITFGLNPAADVSAQYSLSSHGASLQVRAQQQNFEVELNVPGKHNVLNALAAIAASIAANIPPELIKTGLESYRPPAGRLSIHTLASCTVLDDSYNANPASMRAAIDTLAQFENTTLIVGDMAELGEATRQAHIDVGRYARQKDISHVLACGQFSALVQQGYGDVDHAHQARSFTDQPQLIEYISTRFDPIGAVLVKGSRSARMENVVSLLLDMLQTEKRRAN